MLLPTRPASATLAFAALFAAGCHKEPEPEAATAPERTGRVSAGGEASVSPPPPMNGGRCLVPLSDSPPPRAEPAATCPPDPGAPLALPKGWVAFEDGARAPRVEVEIADTPPARERGLMYRTEMAEDHGMLFSWPTEEPRAFWMHHTCLPLDMLFIAEDGTIAGILEEVPVLNDTARGVPCPAAHVLELRAGWSRAHGLAPGQKVRIER